MDSGARSHYVIIALASLLIHALHSIYLNKFLSWGYNEKQMNGIGGFLKKYLDFTPPEKAVVRATSKVLEELFGIPFNEQIISVRNQNAFISTDATLKSEIVFQKQKILSRVNELTRGALVDIH